MGDKTKFQYGKNGKVEFGNSSSHDKILQKTIVVKPVDWKITDCYEIKAFFEKFGSVFSVKRDYLNLSAALVTFDLVKSISEVVHLPDEDLIFKDQVLQIEKAKDRDLTSNCASNIGDGNDVAVSRPATISSNCALCIGDGYNVTVPQPSTIAPNCALGMSDENDVAVAQLASISLNCALNIGDDNDVAVPHPATFSSNCALSVGDGDDASMPLPAIIASNCALSIGDGYDVAVQQPTTINSVPNEVLDMILSFLGIEERIRTERVCKNWRSVGKEQSWSSPSYFAVCDLGQREKSSLPGIEHLSDEILKAVLSRCGFATKEIKLSNTLNRITIDQTFKVISNFCPNLTKIDVKFTSLPVSENCLAILGDGCRKLREVRLFYQGEKKLVLRAFFETCRSLESLTLEGEQLGPESSDFEVINTKLRSLYLECGNSLLPKALNSLLKRCDSIQELHISSAFCFKFPEAWLTAMQRYCDTLTVLDLTCNAGGASINWCKFLSKFRRLEELYIDEVERFECRCSDECFAQMSTSIRIFYVEGSGHPFEGTFVTKLLERNCHLQELELLYCALPPELLKLCCKYADCMKELTLRGMRLGKLSDWCSLFASLRNLEALKLDFCSAKVNDTVIQTVVQSCRKLKVLSLSKTAITDDGLAAIATLPLLTDVKISFLDCISDEGVMILAAQGRLEKLDISRAAIFSGQRSEITDLSCCLLARLCPNFCNLKAENVTALSNVLVDTFCQSLQDGYLKHQVTLYLMGTSVTPDCRKHELLSVEPQTSQSQE